MRARVCVDRAEGVRVSCWVLTNQPLERFLCMGKQYTRRSLADAPLERPPTTPPTTPRAKNSSLILYNVLRTTHYTSSTHHLRARARSSVESSPRRRRAATPRDANRRARARAGGVENLRRRDDETRSDDAPGFTPGRFRVPEVLPGPSAGGVPRIELSCDGFERIVINRRFSSSSSSSP